MIERKSDEHSLPFKLPLIGDLRGSDPLIGGVFRRDIRRIRVRGVCPFATACDSDDQSTAAQETENPGDSARQNGRHRGSLIMMLAKDDWNAHRRRR